VVKSVQPPDDVPTPEGAVMVTTMSMMGTNFYQYRSEQEPEGIIAFYKEELPKKGWTAGDAIEGQSGMITFTKDKTTLTITVTKNPDTGKTDITVMMTTE